MNLNDDVVIDKALIDEETERLKRKYRLMEFLDPPEFEREVNKGVSEFIWSHVPEGTTRVFIKTEKGITVYSRFFFLGTANHIKWVSNGPATLVEKNPYTITRVAPPKLPDDIKEMMKNEP